MSNEDTGVVDDTFVIVLWCRIYPPVDSWASFFYFHVIGTDRITIMLIKKNKDPCMNGREG